MSAPAHRGSENGNRYSPTGREVLTRSGILIDVTAPRADQIVLSDIAVSLAEQKRFTGHCPLRPTVVAHSLAVEWIGGMLFQMTAYTDPLEERDLAERNCRRECLMHDAPEFLVSDLNGAVKKDIRPPAISCAPAYPTVAGIDSARVPFEAAGSGPRGESRFDELESLAEAAIAERFGLTHDWGHIVHEADVLACAYEMAHGGWCKDAHPPRWVAESVAVRFAYGPSMVEPGLVAADGGELAFLARAEFLGIR